MSKVGRHNYFYGLLIENKTQFINDFAYNKICVIYNITHILLYVDLETCTS